MTVKTKSVNTKSDLLPRRNLLQLGGYSLLGLLTACSPMAQQVINKKYCQLTCQLT